MSVTEVESGAITWPGASTDGTYTKPSGIADNDVMVAVLLCEDEARTFDTVPAGWTTELDVLTGSGRLGVFSKVVTSAAGEPANYVFQLDANPGALKEYYGVGTLWRGADHDDVLEALRWQANSTSTSHPSPDISPEIVDGTLAINYFGIGVPIWTAPGGMTEQSDASQNNSGGTGLAVELATLDLTDEGQVGAKTATSSLSVAGVAVAYVMRPESPLDAPVRVEGSSRVDLDSAATTIAVTRPAVKVGQLMLAAIGYYTPGIGAARVVTDVPDGWTLVGSYSGTSFGEQEPTLHLAYYVKVAGETEAKSYTWTLSGTSQSSGAILALDGASHVDGANGGGTLASKVTSLSTPDITPTKRHSLIVQAWYVENTPTIPDEAEQQSGGAGVAELYVSTTHKAAASATGQYAATFASSSAAVAVAAIAPRIPVPKALVA